MILAQIRGTTSQPVILQRAEDTPLTRTVQARHHTHRRRSTQAAALGPAKHPSSQHRSPNLSAAAPHARIPPAHRSILATAPPTVMTGIAETSAKAVHDQTQPGDAARPENATARPSHQPHQVAATQGPLRPSTATTKASQTYTASSPSSAAETAIGIESGSATETATARRATGTPTGAGAAASRRRRGPRCRDTSRLWMGSAGGGMSVLYGGIGGMVLGRWEGMARPEGRHCIEWALLRVLEDWTPWS